MTDITLDEIKRLVSLQLGIRTVNEHDRFLEDLAAESADVVNMVAIVEEKYRITIRESEIAGIGTPGELFELVKSRVASRGQ